MKLENGIDTAAWPEQPYQWMANDLHAGIEGKANHLVALGLLCYTEYMGKEVLNFRKDKSGKTYPFDIFFGEYMGYQKLIEKHKHKIYDYFRNGIAHKYYFKTKSIGGIYVSFEPNTKQEFNKININPLMGLIIKTREESVGEHINRLDLLPRDDEGLLRDENFTNEQMEYKKIPQVLVLITKVYFNDFCRGVQKFLEESHEITEKS